MTSTRTTNVRVRNDDYGRIAAVADRHELSMGEALHRLLGGAGGAELNTDGQAFAFDRPRDAGEPDPDPHDNAYSAYLRGFRVLATSLLMGMAPSKIPMEFDAPQKPPEPGEFPRLEQYLGPRAASLRQIILARHRTDPYSGLYQPSHVVAFDALKERVAEWVRDDASAGLDWFTNPIIDEGKEAAGYRAPWSAIREDLREFERAVLEHRRKAATARMDARMTREIAWRRHWADALIASLKSSE